MPAYLMRSFVVLLVTMLEPGAAFLLPRFSAHAVQTLYRNMQLAGVIGTSGMAALPSTYIPCINEPVVLVIDDPARRKLQQALPALRTQQGSK